MTTLDLDPKKEFYGLPVHPVCDLFPMMHPGELENLQVDVEIYGQLNAVIVHEGQLVDGRNRLEVCRRLEIEPAIKEWREVYKGREKLGDWIWSINASRRHMTRDQYIAAEVAFAAWERTERARLKQVEAGKQQGFHGAEGGRGNKKPLEMNSSQGVSEPVPAPARAPQVRKEIAEKLHVSEHKVQQALNVQKSDPELLKQVSRGELALVEASKRTPKRERAMRLTASKANDIDAALVDRIAARRALRGEHQTVAGNTSNSERAEPALTRAELAALQKEMAENSAANHKIWDFRRAIECLSDPKVELDVIALDLADTPDEPWPERLGAARGSLERLLQLLSTLNEVSGMAPSKGETE